MLGIKETDEPIDIKYLVTALRSHLRDTMDFHGKLALIRAYKDYKNVKDGVEYERKQNSKA